MAAENVTRNYYFDPITQIIYEEHPPRGPSVYIQLTAPGNLPQGKLVKIIRDLGNHLAIDGVEERSRDTKSNYCVDYTKHPETCKQAPWSHCQRHLNQQEMDECAEIKENSRSALFPGPGILYTANTLPIHRGDVELMRIILVAVRNAIRQESRPS